MESSAHVFLPAGLEFESILEAIAALQDAVTINMMEGSDGPYPRIDITCPFSVSTVGGMHGYLSGRVGDVKFIYNPQTWYDGRPGQRFIFSTGELDYKVSVELVALFGGYAFQVDPTNPKDNTVAHRTPDTSFFDLSDTANWYRMRNLLAGINPVRMTS